MSARDHAQMVRPPRCLVALLAALVLMGLAVPVRADERSEAREWFERGLSASRSGAFGEAVSAFQRSRELSERPSVLQNLAVALGHLGRYVEALEAVERALALSASTGRREREELERLRAALERKVAELRFEVTPDDALIALDGKAVQGRTVRCDPGAHELRVSAAGHETETRDLTVLEGARSVERFTLRPQPVAAPHEPVAAANEHAPVVSPAPERRLLPWAFVSLGAGVAMAGAGTVLQLHSASEESRWDRRCPDSARPECAKSELASEQRSIDRFDRSSFALFGLAGASALVATTLFWLHGRERRRPLALMVSPRQLQLSVRF